MKGRGKREIPEKTYRLAASSGTIPGANPPRIEPGLVWEGRGSLTTSRPRPPGGELRNGRLRGTKLRSPTLGRFVAGKRASEKMWMALDIEILRADEGEDVSMEQRHAGMKGAGETGDPRENPLTNGIVRHDSHMRKFGVARLGIEPGSHWWEASRLIARPPWSLFVASTIVTNDVVRLLASHQGKPDSIPGGITPRFPHVGIVPDDAAGRRVFSRISRFPPPLRSGTAPYLPRFTRVGSQDLDVKSRLNLSSTLQVEIAVLCDLCDRPAPRGQHEECEVNPPTNGIVRHDSHMGKYGMTRQGIEPRSPWWEASSLTTQPPWPLVESGVLGRKLCESIARTISTQLGKNADELSKPCSSTIAEDFRSGQVQKYMTFHREVIELGDFMVMSLPGNQLLQAAVTSVVWSGANITVSNMRSRGRRYHGETNRTVSLLASDQGELGSILGRIPPRIFTSGNHTGQCHWSAGFLGDVPFSPSLTIRRCFILASFHSRRFAQDLVVKSRSNDSTQVALHWVDGRIEMKVTKTVANDDNYM
ncbi:hypothetical protein PR048_024973 [Dryococelus australis]|uniref:Uncharacterized protein n=1 Tax=Dryococelus australis TaxID=614101 RepID=A0ABQ9GQ56_9NEOP|nr:hypothetical protein PR048_024973 [Dryococelus australis]